MICVSTEWIQLFKLNCPKLHVCGLPKACVVIAQYDFEKSASQVYVMLHNIYCFFFPEGTPNVFFYLQIFSRSAACNKTCHGPSSMRSGNGTKYYVYGTGGDSLSHFCCPAAADTDFVNNTATAAAAAKSAAGPSAAAHHSATASSVTADPAPPAVPTGNERRAVYKFFQVLALSALLGFPGVLYLKTKHLK